MNFFDHISWIFKGIGTMLLGKTFSDKSSVSISSSSILINANTYHGDVNNQNTDSLREYYSNSFPVLLNGQIILFQLNENKRIKLNNTTLVFKIGQNIISQKKLLIGVKYQQILKNILITTSTSVIILTFFLGWISLLVLILLFPLSYYFAEKEKDELDIVRSIENQTVRINFGNGLISSSELREKNSLINLDTSEVLVSNNLCKIKFLDGKLIDLTLTNYISEADKRNIQNVLQAAKNYYTNILEV